MHYSSIAYFQGVMTGKGVKPEIGVWSWQETRPDHQYFRSITISLRLRREHENAFTML